MNWCEKIDLQALFGDSDVAKQAILLDPPSIEKGIKNAASPPPPMGAFAAAIVPGFGAVAAAAIAVASKPKEKEKDKEKENEKEND
jgi:hypothetical protein